MKSHIRKVFWEEPNTAVVVAQRESALKMVQSNHVYTKSAPPGFKIGDREQSFCVFQIHEPAHKDLITRLDAQDFKTNFESCVTVARVVYDQAGGFHPWTEYHNMLVMR